MRCVPPVRRLRRRQVPAGPRDLERVAETGGGLRQMVGTVQQGEDQLGQPDPSCRTGARRLETQSQQQALQPDDLPDDRRVVDSPGLELSTQDLGHAADQVEDGIVPHEGGAFEFSH